MNCTSYYLDANALIKYYKSEPGSLSLKRRISLNHGKIFISPLTIIEFIGVMVKHRRTGTLGRRNYRALVRRLRSDINVNGTSRPFNYLSPPKNHYRYAENLLLHDAELISIGANDALHISIVKNAEKDFLMVSSDGGLKTVCQKIGIKIFDPEVTESS